VTTPLDEAGAWRLLRAIPAGGGEAPPELQVAPDGSWSSPFTLSREAHLLLDLFLPLRLRREWVIGQLGQSLDGRIATESGHSHYITGVDDIRRLHRVRALVQAVVVGAGTVAADDPRLTVREVEGENPVRVVLDPRGRLDPERHVFRDGAASTLVVRGAGRSLPPVPEGVEEVRIPEVDDGFIPPQAVLEALRRRGLQRILVEGGGVTVSSFLQAGVLHRLHVTVAPLLLGSGRPALTLDPILRLDQALRPRCRHFPLGEDLLFDLELAPSFHRGGGG